MKSHCTCEVWAWPDCRSDNQHCSQHYLNCSCPETAPSKTHWCHFVHCPRKEKHVTQWRLFVPTEVSEAVVRGLVKDAGGTFQGHVGYRTSPNTTGYSVEGSRTVIHAILSLDDTFEAYPQT
jgi:hypothetical protein